MFICATVLQEPIKIKIVINNTICSYNKTNFKIAK